MSTLSLPPEDAVSSQQLQRTLWWAVPALFLTCLSLVIMLMGVKPEVPASKGSYDATENGARAAFLLVKELGFNAASSKRIVEGKVRWIIAPKSSSKQFEALPAWIQAGGKVLLADDQEEIASQLGLKVESKQLSNSERHRQFQWGKTAITFDAGTIELTCQAEADETWPANDPKPLVSIYRQGRGEVWLVHLPRFMRNDVLKKSLAEQSGNGLVIRELAQAMVNNTGERIWFDEYFHGMRSHPNVLELLAEPPLLWVSLQGLALLALAFWRYTPRFGTYQELPTPRRRSKEEYLQAMASILERKRAYDSALESVRQSVMQGLSNALALPAGAMPNVIAQQAEVRWPGKLKYQAVLQLLTATLPKHAGEAEFLRALHEWEALRNVYTSN